jgi:mannose-6-phosphate isomerase-like protein (cupin superfamily)
VREPLQQAIAVAASFGRRVPHGPVIALITGASVGAYLLVGAAFVTVTSPSPAPPAGDLPQIGMMLPDPGIKSTFVIRRTTEDTEGAFVEVDVLMNAGGGPGMLGTHRHPGAEERLQVLEGVVTIRVDGTDHTVTAGESVRIPSGVSHSVRNESDRFALVRGRFEPAAHMDTYFVQVHRAGGLGRVGTFTMAALATRFREQYAPGPPPLWLSRVATLLIAPTARLTGMPTHYPPGAAPD